MYSTAFTEVPSKGGVSTVLMGYTRATRKVAVMETNMHLIQAHIKMDY